MFPWLWTLLSIIAIGAHASASVALVFFLFEHWECGIYWWIFVFCRLVHISPFQTFFFTWLIIHPALAVHCSASVSLSFFVFEKWECWTYWVVFAFCRLVFFRVFICNSMNKTKDLIHILPSTDPITGIIRRFINTSALFLFLSIYFSVCLLQCASCLCGDSPADRCFWIEEETLMKDAPNICVSDFWPVKKCVVLGSSELVFL